MAWKSIRRQVQEEAHRCESAHLEQSSSFAFLEGGEQGQVPPETWEHPPKSGNN